MSTYICIYISMHPHTRNRGLASQCGLDLVSLLHAFLIYVAKVESNTCRWQTFSQIPIPGGGDGTQAGSMEAWTNED